jgi:hypothetical protein
MTVIALTSFVGANSDISPPLLDSQFAVEATNVFTDQGALDTWKSPKQVGISPPWNTKTGTIKSLFLLDNTRWLAFVEDVDFALMQKESNADWETIFTGLDAPRYTDKTLSVSGGGTAYPEVSYLLGIPAPEDTKTLVATKHTKATPSNSVRASWQIAGTVSDAIGDRIARSYVYTFVTAEGREGPPSSASNIVYTNDDEYVTLAALTGSITAPTGAYNITKARIYVAGTGGTFNYLKEISLPQTSVDITDNTFGTAIETTTWDGPPDGLTGIVTMANGILAGYVGNNLYFSEPYQSHAWPGDYVKPMDYDIVGLAAIGNMLFISTTGYPVIAVGNTPSYMTFNKLPAKQSNVSSRSMVDMGMGAMYASADGIVLLADGNAVMISDGIISERVYQLMVPSSIHAYFYRDKYIGFYDSSLTGSIAASSGEIIPAKGAFILDYKRKTVTYTDQTCDAAYSDKVSGKLYMVKNVAGTNNLYEWNEGATNLAQAWRSKPTVTPPTTFSAARIYAKQYPLTFELYVDGTLKHTETVANDNVFRLPAGFRGCEWQARVSGDSYVNGIFIAQSVSELQ